MTEKFDVSKYDVLRDADGGWSFNGAVVHRAQIEVPEGSSNRLIEIEARRWGGFTGRRALREDFGDTVRWVDEKTAMAVEVTLG